MTWSKLSLFPQLSLAVHVRVIVEALAQVPAAVTSEDVIVNPPEPQVVVAVAVPVLVGKLEASQDIVGLVGWFVHVIAVAPAEITTSKLQLSEFPHSSVAVNVIVTVPTFWVEPIAGDCVTVIFAVLEQLSLIVAKPV